MGLDLTIYKEKKNGKHIELAYFGRAGWPIVRYLEKHFNKNLNDSQVTLTIRDVKQLIVCCVEVLTAYYGRAFENPRSWVEVAATVFDSYDAEYYDEYNDAYINNIGTIYEKLWEIQEELWDNETVILDISY